MNMQERSEKIQLYGRAYDMLVDGLTRFPKEIWRFKPSSEDWSIHELIVHIADSEANSYIRCRRFLAEPGKSVMAYDESQWARALNYDAQSEQDSLELFKLLRRKSYLLIKDQPEEVWARTVYHPENGVMTMDDWLDVYAKHIPDHLEQMQANYEAWKLQAVAR